MGQAKDVARRLHCCDRMSVAVCYSYTSHGQCPSARTIQARCFDQRRDEDVLATGTPDPLADLATQGGAFPLRKGPHPQPDPESATAGDWGTVYGELITFEDPESRLPAIDRLEGFRPGGRSLYRRVLVPAIVKGASELAWVYTVEATGIKGRRIESGSWPQ